MLFNALTKPKSRTHAGVLLVSSIVIVVLYSAFSNFFLNLSVMLALLAPLFLFSMLIGLMFYNSVEYLVA